jgi:hypothetical protein
VYALNPKQAPRMNMSWERADPFVEGAGQAKGALGRAHEDTPGSQTASSCTTVDKQPGERRPRPLGKLTRSRDKYLSMATNINGGGQMATSQVMETGTPQWLAKRRGNARGAKVSTGSQPSRRNMAAMQGAKPT